jgi:hypothetical protein
MANKSPLPLLLLAGGVLGAILLGSRDAAASTGTNGTNGSGGGNGGNGGGTFEPLEACLDSVETMGYQRTPAGVQQFQGDWNAVNCLLRNINAANISDSALVNILDGTGIDRSHPLFVGVPADAENAYVSNDGSIQVDGDCGAASSLRAQWAAGTQGWWIAVQAASDSGMSRLFGGCSL